MPRIRLLGEVGLWSADEPIVLRSSKQLALLALLAEAHPRPLTRRYVLDTLWPGVDQDRSRRSLNQAVYGIRRRVGAELLRVRLDLLALEGAEWTCDLWEVDELVAHGARTRTPLRRFAESGRLPETPGFIDWVDRSRARVDAHMVSAYCAELSKLMDRGRFEDIEPLARATLDIDPYAETALYHLAMAVAGSGRITAALGELRAARDIFRKDLGRELPTAFSTLEERLESAEAFEAMRRPEGEGSYPAPFAFVGREEEFSVLRAAWDRIEETGRRIILVSGEPGIGKTRLVDRLARLVSIQGGRVLQAECFAAHKRVPFVALSQALRGIRPEEIAQLDLIWRRVLFSAFALEAAGTDLAPPPRLDPEAEQLRLFESVVYAVQAAAAHRPVLFLIDDLQWLDQSSVAILQHLLRRCEEEPVLFVFAARERELRVDDELRAFVANNRSIHFTDVELDVLDEAASEELVRTTRRVTQEASAEEVASIAEALGGHPFLITETARNYPSEDGGGITSKGRRRPKVTQTLDDFFHQIFLPLTRPAKEIAVTIAVWGDSAPAEDLATHLAISPAQLSASIRELEEAGVLANLGT
ncbi:MAG: AAA family ATPase, partial [Gemmatimonadota bacterium]